MKKVVLLAAAVAGLTFVTGQTAEAGHRRGGFQIGVQTRNFGFQYNNGYGYGRGWGRQRYCGPRFGGPGWYHNTGHYDYHPPSYRWHGDHVDYVPGHLHYHDTGHWHPY